ncbi:hypothetical protein KP05_08805 [Cobetia amphilecti]|nr:hypothetical protein KP05_08805 [Cobetia amphilecti]
MGNIGCDHQSTCLWILLLPSNQAVSGQHQKMPAQLAMAYQTRIRHLGMPHQCGKALIALYRREIGACRPGSQQNVAIIQQMNRWGSAHLIVDGVSQRVDEVWNQVTRRAVRSLGRGGCVVLMVMQ